MEEWEDECQEAKEAIQRQEGYGSEGNPTEDGVQARWLAYTVKVQKPNEILSNESVRTVKGSIMVNTVIKLDQ